jgi:uncharacterized protein
MLSVLGILFGCFIVLSAVAPSAAAEAGPKIELTTALGFMLLSVGFGISSLLIVVSHPARQWVARVVIRSDGVQRRYNPDSVVHTTALVLALFEVLYFIGSFILAGGIQGLADELAANGLPLDALLGDLLLNVLLALLGVGLFIRRDVYQTLQRLALNSVKPRQLLLGALIGFSLFWVVVGLEQVWSLLLSPELLAEQSAASEQLFLAFSGSLLAGLFLALTSSIGEEILFRGALQPIFGMVWTSIFFALLHTQYTLTPAAVTIFAVSMAFAWIRQRYDTSTAIVAHFVYNFTPFVLSWFVFTNAV